MFKQIKLKILTECKVLRVHYRCRWFKAKLEKWIKTKSCTFLHGEHGLNSRPLRLKLSETNRLFRKNHTLKVAEVEGFVNKKSSEPGDKLQMGYKSIMQTDESVSE